jgi:RNA polymerase sigma factor (sigma-70 family)
MTLETLAQRAVEGDAAALSELCRRLETPLFRLCLRMLGDVRDAEDACQDVLVKVMTNLSRFERRSSVMTWAHSIAIRHVWGLQKSRAELRAFNEDEFASLLEQGLAYAATQAPQSPFDKALANEVRLSCTQGMLLMLSREERLALVLVDLLGFDGAEAALLLEVSHDAFRQRLARARARLGAFLEKQCGVANEHAACRCEKQIPGKQAMGLRPGRERFAPLSMGDLPTSPEVVAAAEELRHLRHVRAAFHQGGQWRATETLRQRMEQLLPTVLTARPQ